MSLIFSAGSLHGTDFPPASAWQETVGYKQWQQGSSSHCSANVITLYFLNSILRILSWKSLFLFSMCLSGTLSNTIALTLCSRSVTCLIMVAYPSYHMARGGVRPIWTNFLQLFTCLVYFRCYFCITSVIIPIDLFVFSI